MGMPCHLVRQAKPFFPPSLINAAQRTFQSVIIGLHLYEWSIPRDIVK